MLPFPSASTASPRLLAIDSATESVAVAACGPRGMATREAPGGAEASSKLLPAVQAVLLEVGLAAAELDAIAFGAGPGAFTGLRTACAAAQGLAFGLGCPLLALDDLALWAEDSPWRDDAGGPPVWVAVDARMGEVYAGAYRRVGPARWQADVSPSLFTLEALAAAFAKAPPARLAGNAPAVFGDRWPATPAPCHPQMLDRPGALLRLALAAWQRGEAIDPAMALPLYLRDKVALTTTERAAERAARQGHIVNAVSALQLQARPMQAGDVDAVMAIERQAYDFPWTTGNFIDSLSAGYEAELLLDARGARGALAAYRVAMVGVDEMHLLNLTVRPDLQGQGIARLMLDRLVLDCRRLALGTLWLEVRPSNARARALYARWGFHEVGLRRAYYPAAQGRREDAIVMRLAVPETTHGLD